MLSLSVPVFASGENGDLLGQFLAEQGLEQPKQQQIKDTELLQRILPYEGTHEAFNPFDEYSDAVQQADYADSWLNARSALVMRPNTGEILYQKNMDDVRPIASISKLMTAMVILDARLDMNQQVTITEAEIDRLKGTGSRLTIGTTMSRGHLLHLSLMSSENRATHALARSYPGGISAFVNAMNHKARALGMHNTRFYEPTGLDPRNVSTARDLAEMVKAASKYPAIRQLSTSNYASAYTSSGKLQEFKNSNTLIREGTWDIALQKTGYIRESGRSMVLQTQMGRDPVVIVVLGSSNPQSRVNDVRILGSMVQQQLM